LYFQQVAGLAARCTTGIEHPLTWRQLQQFCGQLRRLVLHADPAFGETRQRANVARFGQHDTVLAVKALAVESMPASPSSPRY
jgi:hypothetical protein